AATQKGNSAAAEQKERHRRFELGTSDRPQSTEPDDKTHFRCRQRGQWNKNGYGFVGERAVIRFQQWCWELNAADEVCRQRYPIAVYFVAGRPSDVNGSGAPIPRKHEASIRDGPIAQIL